MHAKLCTTVTGILHVSLKVDWVYMGGSPLTFCTLAWPLYSMCSMTYKFRALLKARQTSKEHSSSNDLVTHE